MIRCFTSWKWGITNPLKTCEGVETINRFTSVIHIMVSKKSTRITNLKNRPDAIFTWMKQVTTLYDTLCQERLKSRQIKIRVHLKHFSNHEPKASSRQKRLKGVITRKNVQINVIKVCPCAPDRIGIWKPWFLRKGYNPKNQEKHFPEQGRKSTTNSTGMASRPRNEPGRNWLGGKCWRK